MSRNNVRHLPVLEQEKNSRLTASLLLVVDRLDRVNRMSLTLLEQEDPTLCQVRSMLGWVSVEAASLSAEVSGLIEESMPGLLTPGRQEETS